MPGRCIEAINLLHFTADAITDWEYNEKNAKKTVHGSINQPYTA